MNQPLSPVNEFLDKIRKKLNSNPLSLSAMAYREILSEGPEMAANEAELIRQAFLEGYKQAFNDIKEHNEHNEKERNEPNEYRGAESAEDSLVIRESGKQKTVRRDEKKPRQVKKGTRISKNSK